MARSDQIVRTLAGLLGVVALGLAAATLTSPQEPGESGGGGEGSGPDVPTPMQPEDGSSSTSIDPSLLIEVLAVLLSIALVVYLVLYFYRNPDHIKYAVAGIVLLGALLAGLWYLVEMIDPEMPAQDQDRGGLPENESGGGEGDGGDDAASDAWELPLWAQLGVIGAVLLVAILLVRSVSNRYRSGTAADREAADEDETAAIGAAASRAADRIEDAPAANADNEVYRAWREMTDLLEVDRPATSTPREFADAAVDAGLHREDVAELTDLFEVVRYGDREPTAPIEQRAVQVFRRIEAEYDEATEDGSGGRADSGNVGNSGDFENVGSAGDSGDSGDDGPANRPDTRRGDSP